MGVMLIIIVAIVLVVFVIVGVVVEDRLLQQLSSPTCTGRSWRNAFPASPKQEVREFHQIVLMAFGIGQRFHLRFAPEVKLMDLYRAVEPPVLSMGVDAMELETLCMEIENRTGVNLSARWQDGLTLGEVFAFTQTAGGLTTGCS